MKIQDEPGIAPERKMTVADIARQEGVSQRTVLNWVERKVLSPAYRIGKIIRFTPEGVERDLRAASSNGEGH